MLLCFFDDPLEEEFDGQLSDVDRRETIGVDRGAIGSGAR